MRLTDDEVTEALKILHNHWNNFKTSEPVVRWLWAYQMADGWYMCGRLMSDKEKQTNENLYPNTKYTKLDLSRQEFDE